MGRLEKVTGETRLVEVLPRSELERRWRAAADIMAANQLDALVMQNSNDWLGGYVRWFTGGPANNGYPRAVVFFGSGDMLIVENGPEGGVTRPSPDDPAWRGVREVRHHPSFTSAHFSVEADARIVADMLAERSARRVGWVNPAGAYFGFGRALERLHGPTLFADVTDAIDRVKAVKSPVEQELIRRTTALQDEVMSAVAGFVRPGLRDFEVGAFAQYEATRRGTEQGIYLCSSSPRGTAAVFRPPFMQGRVLAAGDVFVLLVETNGPGGYFAEIARTFSLGRPAPELIKAVGDAIEGQAAAAAQLKPGAALAQVAASNDAFMVGRGYGPELRLFSHSQGYDMVERPLTRFNEDMTVMAGMNFAIHPGSVQADVNALICDNYMIAADGAEKLHRTSTDIVVL